MTTKLKKLVEYAQTWKRVVDGPRPCIVTIGRKSWPAVWYRQEFDTPAGSRAYNEGERTYVKESFYCLGDLPAAKKRGNAAFPYQGRDWYVAGYGPAKITKQNREYHKLGKSFILSPWDVPDGSTIDQYERHPYKRVPMLVKWV